MLETIIGAAFRSDKDWSRAHDVVVYGAGLVGVSAALAAVRDGHQVTLVDPACDLLWEITRSYVCVKRPEEEEWQGLLSEMEAVLPKVPGLGFVAWAEVAAARLLAQSGVKLLFMARPVMRAEQNECTSISVATKAGPRTLRARRMIDASESGALALALRARTPEPASPIRYCHAILGNADEWSNELAFEPGDHPSEKVIRLATEREHDHEAVAAALAEMKRRAQHPVLVSTSSYFPFPLYDEAAMRAEPEIHDNLILASPACLRGRVNALAQRIDLGVRASDALKRSRAPSPDRTNVSAKPYVCREIRTNVAVIGAGTGGAVAAVAAARNGVAPFCADLNRFPGGTATGSGIHGYWFGVSGGLQEEIDDLVQSSGRLFGAANQMRGYHPEAKRLAYENLFAAHGVHFERGAMLFDVEREGNAIAACLLATDAGLLRVAAVTWIDGTGDGDLSALAGASFARGRDSDGVTSPYTQSAVQVFRTAKRWNLGELNYDSGWVDPADAGDMTRARLVGLEQVLEQVTASQGRIVVAMSPLVGLRQARQIETEHILCLDDIIGQRTFDDAVAHVGAHFDNHMVDYQLESAEAIFWVWCAHQWRTQVASQLPLRAIRPKELTNVLLACRAIGVSRDAHHAIRMMRDMQRIGEAAGTLAAFYTAERGMPAALNLARPKLQASGALFVKGSVPEKRTRFGPDAVTHFDDALDLDPAAALSDLRAGTRSAGLWSLFQDQQKYGESVRDVLMSNDPDASWLAATIVGLWGESAAEHRLLTALETREPGDDKNTAKYCTDPAFQPFPPNWVVAVSILKECGTQRSVVNLQSILEDMTAGLDLQVAAARALTAIVSRGGTVEIERLRAAGEHALFGAIPGVFVRPQETMLSGSSSEQGSPSSLRHNMRWKLIFAFAELYQAAGIADDRFAETLSADPRSLVRTAFRPKVATLTGLEAS